MKILIWDAETSPMRGWFWQRYKTNVLQVDEESHLMCIAWKWHGEKKTFVKALPDYKTYKKDTRNDYELTEDLHALFEQADLIVAHNGDSFDNKVAYARFIFHGFPPPPPHKSVDTLKVARRYFRFSSNRLDDLGDHLDLGRKVQTGGKQLWFDCLDGKMKAWRKMKKYNIQDVDLLERVYEKLAPYHHTHPNLAEPSDDDVCPFCGSVNIVKEGWRTVNSGWTKYRRYRCTDCNKWSRGRGIKNEVNIK